MNISIVDIFSVFMILFAVIDIIGAIPILLDLKAKGNEIEAGKISLISMGILFLFLFLGEQMLNFFGVDISSFAIAGSFILFFLAMEMVLGIRVFRGETTTSATIVPIAFPLVAGAGSITTMLSLRTEYSILTITIALILNIIVVYIVLRLTERIERLLGVTGVMILRKIFGIILLAIAIRLFMSNVVHSVENFFPGLMHKINSLPKQ
jgi:multiple antibiotic resistance protein